jgi:hypothetical protein
MTEAEWLACTDPQPMLEFLRGKVSDRKLRLFAGACCRRIWQHLSDERSRRLVEVSDGFADGTVNLEAVQSAFEEACNAQEAIHWESGDAIDQSSAEAVLGLRGELLIGQVFDGIAEAVAEVRAGEAWQRIYMTPGKHYREQEAEHQQEYDAGAEAEAKVQVAILRDIFGNPFRPVAFDPAWRTPNVTAVAQTIYDARHFEDMPMLADALEEAGCCDDEILGHCRHDWEHFRGCHVLDLILSKDR